MIRKITPLRCLVHKPAPSTIRGSKGKGQPRDSQRYYSRNSYGLAQKPQQGLVVSFAHTTSGRPLEWRLGNDINSGMEQVCIALQKLDYLRFPDVGLSRQSFPADIKTTLMKGTHHFLWRWRQYISCDWKPDCRSSMQIVLIPVISYVLRVSSSLIPDNLYFDFV